MDNVAKARMKASVMNALVQHDIELVQLYHESAEFHAAIEMLGNIAPDIVETMASNARNHMTARALLTDQLTRWPFDKDGTS